MILGQCSIQKQTVVYLMLNFFNTLSGPGFFWVPGKGGGGWGVGGSAHGP